VKKNQTLIVVGVVVAIVAISSLIFLSYGNFLPPPYKTGGTVRFTIIEGDPPSPLAGLNGSYYKSATTQWPVMKVALGDTVIITIENLNSSYEPHGFAIDHYLSAPGYTLSPGQTRTFTFVATKAGYFRVYCSIECSIHPLMQNGALYVASS
jgi:FtsP/CotA-like multicopper oxidase with cupredoxin domain